MRLQNKTIATLIAEGAEDLEYYVPLMRLQEEGAQMLSAGLDLKSIKGKNGLVITPDAMMPAIAGGSSNVTWFSAVGIFFARLFLTSVIFA